MAYRIFFSGLVFFVRRGAFEDDEFERVDALLLNPCAAHHAGNEGEEAEEEVEPDHADPHHDHDEAGCPDRHVPQLSIKRTDVAEFEAPGVVHGCGWHHFDLSGRTLFPQDDDREIELPTPEFDELAVDPLGLMRHVSYKQGVVDMTQVLAGLGPNPGRLDPSVTDLVTNQLGRSLVGARVRLPKGRLTALALLDHSPKRAAEWRIGQQTLGVLSEVVMFVPDDPDNLLEFDDGASVTLRNRPDDTTVWITSEPVQFTRNTEPHVSGHFKHYYELLPTGDGSAVAAAHAASRAPGGNPVTPRMKFPANTGDPLCPGSGGEEDPPGFP
jgi:hypothetical protein